MSDSMLSLRVRQSDRHIEPFWHWRSPVHREPDTSESYSTGVTRVLRSAALMWSGVMSVAQFFVFENFADSFQHATAIRVLFVVHACCWLATVALRSSAWAPVTTWALVCVALAVSADSASIGALRLVLNVCLCVGIVAALLGTPRTALVGAGVLSGVTGLAIGFGSAAHPYAFTSYYALVIPVYTLCSTAAVALLTSGWRDIAELTDNHRSSRERTECTVVRGIAVAELASHQSRVLHDTVVNTLGAVANGAIVSGCDAIRARCAADVRAIDALERFRIPGAPTISDLVGYAETLDIDLVVHGHAELDALVARQPQWRRQEIIGVIGESIINAAKHSGADRVGISVDESDNRVVISDEGVGIDDTATLVRALSLRARDAMVLVDVESAPGEGTRVRLTVPPLQSVDGRNILADSISGIAVRLVPILLVEFFAVALLATTFRTGWSTRAVAPALAAWLIVAAVLITLTSAGRRGGRLPARVVAVGYVGMIAAGTVAAVSPLISGAPSANGGLAPSNMAWLGDAAAGICICFILIDGRRAVVLPLLMIGATAMLTTMLFSANATSSAVVTLFADALLIAVFAVVRSRTAALAIEIEDQHRSELFRREELERRTAEMNFHAVQGYSMLKPARALLTELVRSPQRMDDPDVRAAAAVEESALRALIATPVGQQSRWLGVIESARSAQVLLTLHFFGGEALSGGDVTDDVVRAVIDCIGDARSGERVTVGVFNEDSPVRVTVVADTFSDGIVELGGA